MRTSKLFPGPMDIRLGNSILTWRENLVCAEAGAGGLGGWDGT